MFRLMKGQFCSLDGRFGSIYRRLHSMSRQFCSMNRRFQLSSLRAQDPPQQRISGDERDFVTTAEPLRQPFSAVFGPVEPFWRGELLRRDRPKINISN